MPDFFDLDEVTEDAFEVFTRMLAEAIRDMPVDHEVVVRQLAGHRSQKLMRLCRTSSGVVVWALDNSSLPAERALTRSAQAKLRGLGFQRSKHVPGYRIAAFCETDLDEAAVRTVVALRECYGVLHPALLTEPVFPSPPLEPDLAPHLPASLDERVVVVDGHHLLDLVAGVFTARGLDVHRHDDGTTTGDWHGCEVNVAPQRDLDTIRVWAPLPVSLAHPGASVTLDGLLAEDGREFGMFDVVREGAVVQLEATVSGQLFHGAFVAELIDDLVAERPAVARELSALLGPDPLIRADGVDE